MAFKGLLCVFAEAFWRDYLNNGRIDQLVQTNGFSDKEKMRLMACCSSLLTYLRGDLDLDKSDFEAIIWAISQYGHDVLEIEPRIDIESHLLRCARTEPELHVVKEYYRDHFFHCLEVCFLGHFLLEMHIRPNRPLWEKAAFYLGFNDYDENNKNAVMRLWYVTALFHDVGYLMDALRETNRALKFFKNSPAIATFYNQIEDAIKDLSKNIDRDDFCGYSVKDKAGEDHGVISALHLEGLLKKISKDIPSFNIKKYFPAVEAIGFHNIRKMDETSRVSFKKNPMAFLLILCDTLQEWVRPRLTYSTAPLQLLSYMMGQNQRDVNVNGPFKSLTIENIRRPGGNYELVPVDGRKILKFKLEYDEQINRNSGVFNLWVDATCNLQRLCMEGLGDLNIQIEYITPFYRQSPEIEPVQQLYRLRSAVQETHMGFMERWFPNRSGTYETKPCVTNDAVYYFCLPENKPSFEHLVIDLQQLCKQHLITKGIDDFREHLAHWEHYNDDRDFQGDYAPKEPD